MKINVLLFGIATDLIGNSSLQIELPINCSVTTFKELLISQNEALKEMSTYAVAINESYASDDVIIKNSDIIAIIPPVSGG